MVLVGDGRGHFEPSSIAPIALGHQAWSFAIADLDGDGHADVVAAGAPGHVRLLLGNGTGGFRAAHGSPYRAGVLPAAAVGDVNRDGRLDVVTANRDSHDLTILLRR